MENKLLLIGYFGFLDNYIYDFLKRRRCHIYTTRLNPLDGKDHFRINLSNTKILLPHYMFDIVVGILSVFWIRYLPCID
jgi:hypothetical protein